MGFILYLKT